MCLVIQGPGRILPKCAYLSSRTFVDASYPFLYPSIMREKVHSRTPFPCRSDSSRWKQLNLYPQYLSSRPQNLNPTATPPPSIPSFSSNTLPPATINLALQLPRHRTPYITINAQIDIPEQTIISFLAEHELMALSEPWVDLAVAGQIWGVEPAAVGFGGG